jgi:hypothetical protein
MDWGFVGDAYAAANPDQDAQELINWFPEEAQSEHAKEKWTLLGCPGLVQVASTVTGEVRGCWALPGGQQCLWVVGSSVYLMTVSVAATSVSFPTYAMALIGSIASSAGQVSIRDNATGGIAVIVDGTAAGYVYNLAAKTLAAISDAGFYGADKVAFIDGWLVFNKPGTQIFYTSPLYWNGTTKFDATYFALKDSSTDQLVTMIESLREIWLIGERTSEVWYDAGNQYFPFSRLQGVSLQIGTCAKHSITRFDTGMAWLAGSERGQNLVVMSEGYQVTPISTEAVAAAINSYPVVSDAVAYSYSEGGHTFYVITFPSADVTWCYDKTAKRWHKRASGGTNHRHLSNCYANFQNQRLVGDFSNGLIYALNRGVYTDNGAPLVALRRTAHVWDGDQRERISHNGIQVQLRAGQGPETGQGANPQLMVRWSGDSGQTWSNQRLVSIGQTGDTRHRAITRRLGAARDRIYEVSISDPVCRDVLGASLQVSQ